MNFQDAEMNGNTLKVYFDKKCFVYVYAFLGMEQLTPVYGWTLNHIWPRMRIR